MGTVISNLKARFSVDTTDFKKGLKDGEKAVDGFKDAAGNSVTKLADLFGINMSAVNGALDSTKNTLNFLSQSFKAGASGGNKFAIAMKVVKLALISTGIGALVVALGSVVAYFSKAGRGADQFAVIMARIRSVIDNVLARLAAFGEGMVLIVSGKFQEGWTRMKEAVKGFGEELKEDWKAAGDLAKREDELYDRETKLITSLEERKQKIEELRLKAKDLDLTESERQKALQDAMGITQGMIEDEVALEADRLAIIKEKLALASKDPTDEQLREIAEQEAKLSQIRAQGTSEIRGMTREFNSLTKSINTAAEAEKKLAAETEKAWQSMVSTAKPETPKLFDMTKVSTEMKNVQAVVTDSLSQIEVQLSSVFEDTFENLAAGLGEFLGNLAVGKGGIEDFGRMVAGTFADMAITVGKIAIATGIAVGGIKAALESLNPAVAIAAGIALVALGSLVKGALSNAASGSTSVSASSRGYNTGSFVYDTRLTQGSAMDKIEITGKLTAEGTDLVYIFNKEVSRRKSTT